jgi:hypothetical protein
MKIYERKEENMKEENSNREQKQKRSRSGRCDEDG